MKAVIQRLAAPQRSFFIYRMKSASQFRFNWHFHPEYELTLIDRSSGKRFVGDSICDYHDGDLVLLGPNLPHTWQSAPSSPERTKHQAYVIQFGPHFLGNELLQCAELRYVQGLLKRSVHGLSFSGSVTSAAAVRIRALRRLSGVRRLTGLLELLDLLARSRKASPISSPAFVPSLHREHHRLIDRVCQYLTDHYKEGVSQKEVAELVGKNPAVFSSFFKKTVGVTFVKYVNSLRISHACQLLIDTDLSVLEICHRSGFNNLSNFNRRFLQEKRINPRKYRSQYQPAYSS
ncbi:MAG: AraC family transcriptional regulator [Planctomycetes bacterium]|nr:AraC family transcriptional regulator [Planctomycetota bacterium]